MDLLPLLVFILQWGCSSSALIVERKDCEENQKTCQFNADHPVLGSGEMFDSISGRYDAINRIMSLGMDQSWRRRMVNALEVNAHEKVLDLATGTADVAIIEAQNQPSSTILGVDPSAKMLAIGREKLEASGLEDRVTLELGDAMDLSGIENGTFDKVSIAFGIRNIRDRMQALKEMRRVIKSEPMSRLAILEFAEPSGGVMEFFARMFIKHVVPVVGALLSGKWNEYMHLEESIMAFPSPKEFSMMMSQAGFEVMSTESMMFSSVILYLAAPK